MFHKGGVPHHGKFCENNELNFLTLPLLTFFLWILQVLKKHFNKFLLWVGFGSAHTLSEFQVFQIPRHEKVITLSIPLKLVFLFEVKSTYSLAIMEFYQFMCSFVQLGLGQSLTLKSLSTTTTTNFLKGSRLRKRLIFDRRSI